MFKWDYYENFLIEIGLKLTEIGLVNDFVPICGLRLKEIEKIEVFLLAILNITSIFLLRESVGLTRGGN
jgi:hypothetical protein